MGDLDWVRLFSPKPLVVEFFSATYKGVRFFLQEYKPFSVSDIFFLRYFLTRNFFFPQTQSAGYIFFKSPLPPSKVK